MVQFYISMVHIKSLIFEIIMKKPPKLIQIIWVRNSTLVHTNFLGTTVTLKRFLFQHHIEYVSGVTSHKCPTTILQKVYQQLQNHL